MERTSPNLPGEGERSSTGATNNETTSLEKPTEFGGGGELSWEQEDKVATKRGQRGENIVGLIVSLTLGLSLLSISVAVVIDSLTSSNPQISDVTIGLLSSVLGGTLGAVGAYLGLPPATDR